MVVDDNAFPGLPQSSRLRSRKASLLIASTTTNRSDRIDVKSISPPHPVRPCPILGLSGALPSVGCNEIRCTGLTFPTVRNVEDDRECTEVPRISRASAIAIYMERHK